MSRNELISYQIPLALNVNEESITLAINDYLATYSHVYSWILYDKTNEYRLDVLVSETVRYNTLLVETLPSIVYETLSKYHANRQEGRKNAIAFRQPPLEILCETYKPLI